MRVSKWGNSLAVRLPAELVDTLGLKEGDEVDLGVDRENFRSLALVKRLTDAEVEQRLKEFEGRMPRDFKFDRDEANER